MITKSMKDFHLAIFSGITEVTLCKSKKTVSIWKYSILFNYLPPVSVNSSELILENLSTKISQQWIIIIIIISQQYSEQK